MAKAKTKNGNEGFILSTIRKKLYLVDFLSPLASVMLRVWVGLIFWKSGLTKIASWDSTVFLFQEEYKTHEKITFFGNQIMSPEVAAFFATTGELIFPILLIVGLGARTAATFLLIMTAVIEFTYQSFDAHVIWAIVLSTIILQGAGRFSWDYFIRANYFGFSKDDSEKDKLFATFGTLCVTIYAGYLIFNGLIK